jgi:hypothetical protein
MKGLISRIQKYIEDLLRLPIVVKDQFDETRFNQGVILCELISTKKRYSTLANLEYKVYSQFGDDGIIQFLTKNIECKYKTFIEFGVESYAESNTRFLLQKDNWSGFIMDGSPSNISIIKKKKLYWKYDLEAVAKFITRENIVSLIDNKISEWKGVDLLHIDLDGNDYWIWEKIKIKPTIVILEYNSLFGFERSITVPYDPNFERTMADSSDLYWGSSLKALYDLSMKKGYSFIGCNSAGNNAYFILKDKMNERVKEVTLSAGFVEAKYRESRDKTGDLTFLTGLNRQNAIKGLLVFNIKTQKVEKL